MSYICQKEQIDRKANPTRMVLLLFSLFIIFPLFFSRPRDGRLDAGGG